VQAKSEIKRGRGRVDKNMKMRKKVKNCVSLMAIGRTNKEEKGI